METDTCSHIVNMMIEFQYVAKITPKLSKLVKTSQDCGKVITKLGNVFLYVLIWLFKRTVMKEIKIKCPLTPLNECSCFIECNARLAEHFIPFRNEFNKFN